MSAQRRLVEEVKEDLKSQSLTVSSYTSALSKLTPALTDSATLGDPETWYVAGKICFDKFDKYQSLKAIGQKADEADMFDALISGYGYYATALSLDTIPERDKSGQPRIDKKTGRPRYRAKYSKDIIRCILTHYSDYKSAGRMFYSTSQKFGKAYKAWHIYTTIPRYASFAEVFKRVSRSELGEYCYYKGVAAKLDGCYTDAMMAFREAISLGYNKRDVFDNAISCAEHEQNDTSLVAVTKDAYELYGKDDPRYIRILYNYSLKYGKFDLALDILDRAIDDYPNEAEYYSLKGVLLEHQSGSIEGSYECFSMAVVLDPTGITSNLDMGRYYQNMALAETDEARKMELQRMAVPYLERVRAYEPFNKAATDALRAIYYNLNDPRYETLGK